MFPKAKKANQDTVAPARRCSKKKLSLLGEMGVSEDDVDAGEDEDEEDEDNMSGEPGSRLGKPAARSV